MKDLTPLNALAGRLIPASTEFGVPGADDPAIFAEVMRELQPKVAAIEDLHGALSEIGVDEIERRPLGELLAPLTKGHGGPFGLFAMTVLQAYYRDDRVLQALGVDARPPFPKGYAVEEGDLSLLEPVKARGRIWRRAT